jgi:hypothetical protein
VVLSAGTVRGQSTPIEFSDFVNPKRVGVDPLTVGQDTVIIGFDFAPDGSPLDGGAVVDSLFAGVGVRFRALLTKGPKAGTLVSCQALDFDEVETPVSAPNILSGVDPDHGPNASGEIAGSATIIVTFLDPTGEPASVKMAGAFNDLVFDRNQLTAYSGPDASGTILGTVSATGAGDFFGLKSPEGIGSISFAGHSTEVDDLVFTPPGEPLKAGVEARQTGRRCVSLFLTNDKAIKGGEVGISYDPTKVIPIKVSAGPDFPPGGDLQSNLSAPIACSPQSGTTAGLTVAWLNSVSAAPVTPPGEHNLIRVCFAPASGDEVGDCSELKFVSCLGPEEAPVRAIVTDEKGESVPLSTVDGQVCVQAELTFRRGDANADGNFDVSDPISILGCLFLGTYCSPCPDASDANDDGLVNIADPSYLLNWRFLGGQGPPPPFSSCGQDPTTDALDDCEESPTCQ